MPILLTGDFNCRTGSLNEIMMLDTHDHILDKSHFKYPNIIDTFESLNIPVKRTNADPMANNHGEKLIELCQLHELCIINGRIGADKNQGEVTCAGASTVDYIICTPDLLQNIKGFNVGTFDPLLSDKHSPINISINLDSNSHVSTRTTTDNNDTDKYFIKRKWDDSKKKTEF